MAPLADIAAASVFPVSAGVNRVLRSMVAMVPASTRTARRANNGVPLRAWLAMQAAFGVMAKAVTLDVAVVFGAPAGKGGSTWRTPGLSDRHSTAVSVWAHGSVGDPSHGRSTAPPTA